MTFAVGKFNPCGKGVWKFKTSLLRSDSFCEEMLNFLWQWRTQKLTVSDPRVWWDTGKLLIKQIAIDHSVRIAKDRKSKSAALQKEYKYNINTNKRIPSGTRGAKVRGFKPQRGDLFFQAKADVGNLKVKIGYFQVLQVRRHKYPLFLFF